MTQISHAGEEALTDHRPAASVADAPVVQALAHPGAHPGAPPEARWSPRQGPQGTDRKSVV